MTKFARVDGSRVAFGTMGEGPPLVWLPAGSSHVDLVTEHGPMRLFIEALAEFATVVWFDHRGMGVSDPWLLPDEQWSQAAVADALAVMDACGHRQFDVLAFDASGPLAVRLAVEHPDRVGRVALLNSTAGFVKTDDHPFGFPANWAVAVQEAIEQVWGTGLTFAAMDPWVAEHPDVIAWWAKWERSAGSPASHGAAYRRQVELDARPLVSSVTQPVLVQHANGDPYVHVEHGRWLADNLGDVRYVEYEGDGHLFMYRHRAQVVALLHDFLIGEPWAPSARRELLAILFTDIVSSTEEAVAAGDSDWTSLLEAHDSLALTVVAAHRGELVKSTGDGLLATFQSPSDALDCAVQLRRTVTSIGLEIRAGVHVGEVERREGDIAGVAVHIAARVQGHAAANEIFVSSATRDVVAGSPHLFEDRGSHQLKGLSTSTQLCALTSPNR